jgi:hypothetical protein
MRYEKTYTAAIDVVDASNEKDESEDPPAQSGYGALGLRRAAFIHDRVTLDL